MHKATTIPVLYVCETWSHTLRENDGSKVSENRESPHIFMAWCLIKHRDNYNSTSHLEYIKDDDVRAM